MARNTLAPGGYIGGEPPRRPYFNQLSGVWKLEDAMERQRAGTWANPLGIEDLFSTYLYTGNDSTRTITNGIDLSGKGGLVWIKGRTIGNSHNLYDTTRGATKYIGTNNVSAESTLSQGLTAFGSTGFTLGNDNFVNASAGSGGGDYASWTFRKAAKFFDVVTWTGDGTNGRSISHALTSTPRVIIVKRTDTTSNWAVYSPASLWTGESFTGLYLNTTAAVGGTTANGQGISAVSSTSFTVISSGSNPLEFNPNTNAATYVAYLFAHDAGGFGDSGNESVVKCGSYTGNGSTSGPTIDLGWEPQWVTIKRTDAGGGWFIFDNMRGIVTGGNDPYLRAESSSEEFTGGNPLEVTSTGFRLINAEGSFNASGGTFIYIAIRRGPMKTPTVGTQVFEAAAYTGSGANPRTIGTLNVTDLAVNMTRSASGDVPIWIDRLRGGERYLDSSATSAEAGGLTGWKLEQTGQIINSVRNTSSTTYIDWLFRRAPGFFDVVAYTGTGSARTVSHNLGVVPELYIIKNRTSSALWAVGGAVFPAPKDNYLQLQDSASLLVDTDIYQVPTATTIGIGTKYPNDFAWNRSGNNYIAYLFATCPGVSKVGSYTGTGTTQQINCGFTAGARFVLIKRTDSTGDWYVWDTARGIVSGNDPYLLLNSTAAEVTNTDYIDPYSPGFEISSTAPAAINANGGNFIYFSVA